MDDTETTFVPTGYMVIDTETSKLPDYGKSADHPDQPRLADFAAILLDTNFVVEREWQRYVLPNNWSMDPGATAVNGLTDAFLYGEGIDVAEVLDFYAGQITAGRAVVAYGAQFDCKIMRGEIRRNDPEADDLFEHTFNVCLMREARPFAKQIGREIIKAGGNNKGWPKLSDLCAFLGVERGEKQHGALSDARDTARCLQIMWSLGYTPQPRIHRSKNLEAIRSNT